MKKITITKQWAVLLVVSLVSLAVTTTVLLVNFWPDTTVILPDEQVPLAGLRLDENTEDYGSTLEDRTPEASGIKIPGYGKLSIPANSTEIELTLPNPEGNPCYFVFELVLVDTGKSLFTSQLVAPGKCLSAVTLDQAIPVGEHDLIIRIRTFSLEGQTEMNGADVTTSLEVLA